MANPVDPLKVSRVILVVSIFIVEDWDICSRMFPTTRSGSITSIGHQIKQG